MNWKREAENDLRSYLFKKQSIDNNTERIQALRLEQRGIQAVKIDPTPGGSSQTEDRQTNIICEVERIKLTRAATAHLVKIIERGLDVLDDRERLVLQNFYIDRPKNYLDYLTEELHVEKTAVYKIKDTALHKFATTMYGLNEY